MSRDAKDVIVMSRRKFMIFLSGLVFGTIVIGGIVGQLLDRLF